MLCEHGNIAPCVECDIGPLKAENEALRTMMATLVEALEYAIETLDDCDMNMFHNVIEMGRAALDDYRHVIEIIK